VRRILSQFVTKFHTSRRSLFTFLYPIN
jgi:hypothetical protein